jgi:hypothetical protein
VEIDYDLEDAKLIQAGFLKNWDMFIHWFTWFFGANLLTMSWVVTGTHIHGGPLIALSLTWIVCTLIGMYLCRLMGKYTQSTNELLKELFTSPNQLRDSSVSLVTGFMLTNYAWKGAMSALAITIPSWIFLLIYYFNDAHFTLAD